jgi:hypothetical protein
MFTGRGRSQALTFLGWLTLGIVACGRQDVTEPSVDSHFRGPALNVLSNEYCPVEVPPEDCRAMSQAQREDMWWDLELGVQWWDQDCATAGRQMQDFVLNGDMRVYTDFDNMVTVGWWGRFTDTGHEVIGINSGLWGQGWQGQRLNTGIHEGVHKWRRGGGETEAGHFADYCINW